MRKTFGVARLLLATLELVSLTGYFIYTLGVASFAIANFFGYFTVLSAIATVFVLATAAGIALRRPRDPAWLDMARVMITTYVLVSGIVYAIIVLQAAGVNYSIAVPWSSQILHFWIPAILLLDWIVDPYKARVPWRYLAWVIVFPIIWLVFTLIRGDQLGWYPYFFLDARQVSGPAETVLYCALIVVIITGIAAILVTATRITWKPRNATTSMTVLHAQPNAHPATSAAPLPADGQHPRQLKRSRSSV